jgi:chromatin remodeling complex protein RSC6
MDIMHIASVTIYSKIINEVLTKFDLNIYLLSGIFMFFFAKELCYRTTIIKTIGTATSQWFDHDESSMELTTHQKVYTHLHGKLKKQFYSDYYQALLYYLENLNGIEMSKFVEIMKVNYTESYEYENGREYMLIPDCNYRTKICEKYKNKHDIYIEVIKKNTYSENSKDKNDSPEESTPLYKFVISTPGKNNFKVLQKESSRELKESKKKEHKHKNKNGKKRKPSGFAKPSPISEDLGNFFDLPVGTEMARTEVTSKVIAYVKTNNLQNPENKKQIILDDKLNKLLNPGKDENNNDNIVTYFNLQTYLINSNNNSLFIQPYYSIIFYNNENILQIIDNSTGSTMLYNLITFNQSLLCTKLIIQYKNINI